MKEKKVKTKEGGEAIQGGRQRGRERKWEARPTGVRRRKKMHGNIGSSCAKELFCYFHVGGKFERNNDGEVKYVGGNVKVKVLKDGIRVEDLREIISRLTGHEGSCCDIKYTVMFDQRTLIDLDNDGEIENLFGFNESSAHVFVAHIENANESLPMNDADLVHRFLQRSPEAEVSPMTHGNDLEPVSVEIGGGCITYETEQTNFSDTSYLKWSGVISGVGQHFPHADALREALYKYSIAHKFVYKYDRNSKDKMYVKCKVEGCPWKLCASAAGRGSGILCVTKFIKDHVHSAQDHLQVSGHGARSTLTSSLIIDEVRNHTEKRPTEIMKTMQREYGVKLTYKQAYRAKEKAMEDIHGRPEQSYMLIPWICQRLKETDAKTVAEWVAHGCRFERVFIAYGACIAGFMGGARHVLYVDGTHLSGPYKGTLLAASAYDADNELLPFAIAIVRGETLDDWTWFMHMIKRIVGSMELTIVSDRHNGIIGAVAAIFGGHRHAFCYRHVKENFSAEILKINRGKRKTSTRSKEDGLMLLDKIAYARRVDDFDKAMEQMREHCQELYEWINNHGDVDRWALSKFPYKRWDNITTNIAESFNAWMVKERKYNVAQLIHAHREKVAKKMHASYVAMTKWKNCVGPNIDAKIMENVSGCEHMWCEDYGQGRFSVHTARGDHGVDLRSRQCSCGAWQMSGIPCTHACAGVKVVHGNIYDYVEECFKIEAQQKIYQHSMIPVVTIDMPDVNDYRHYTMENMSEATFLHPPITSRPPGRPRVRRQESQFQNRQIYRCTRCHEAGHTRRTCKNPNPC